MGQLVTSQPSIEPRDTPSPNSFKLVPNESLKVKTLSMILTMVGSFFRVCEKTQSAPAVGLECQGVALCGTHNVVCTSKNSFYLEKCRDGQNSQLWEACLRLPRVEKENHCAARDGQKRLLKEDLIRMTVYKASEFLHYGTGNKK